MSAIKTTDTTGLPEKTVIRTGRTGRVVTAIPWDGIGTIFELAFEGQLFTECYWDTELTTKEQGQ